MLLQIFTVLTGVEFGPWCWMSTACNTSNVQKQRPPQGQFCPQLQQCKEQNKSSFLTIWFPVIPFPPWKCSKGFRFVLHWNKNFETLKVVANWCCPLVSSVIFLCNLTIRLEKTHSWSFKRSLLESSPQLLLKSHEIGPPNSYQQILNQNVCNKTSSHHYCCPSSACHVTR